MSYQHQQQPLALSRSKGSNTSTTSTSSISVIVGKTFEATTHPTNGTQQIIETTKYKRLSDGYIYKETKLRSLEEVLSYDNDDDSSNVVEERVRRENGDVENVGHHRRVSSGAVTARIHNMKSQVADSPSAANNGSISMRNLGPQHPLRQITNHQQQQVCPPSSVSPQRHNPMKPSTNKGGQQSMYLEQEVVSTFSSSYSSNTFGEDQSVITEEHEVFPAAFPQPQQQQGERRYRQQNQGRLSKGGYGQNGRDNNEGKHCFDEESESYVEEYTYENDAKEYDAQAWQQQQQEQYQQEQYQQQQGGRENVEGWNPFGTDNSIADDSIQLNNRLPSKQQGNKSSFNKKLSVSTFFNSGNQYDEEEDNSPIDLKGEEEETPSSSGGGGGMFSRSKSNNKLMNCRNISICAMLLVVVGIVTTIGLLVPSIKNQSPTKLEEEVDKAPSCFDLGNIDLQIVISSTDSNIEDVNSWSLVRANENGTVSTINSLDDLPEVTNEEQDVNGGQQYIYKNCVEPGLYTFTISDSAGNGLGGGELDEEDDSGDEGSSSGYYITANDVTLGVSSFFFHEEKMTFTLPFGAEEVEDTSDETAETGDEEMDTVCTDDFFLAIKTDGKPNESTWNVIDNGTQEEVLSGGPYDMEWTVYTHRACLPNGHYTFNMFDEGEDGVCCDGGGKGFFVLQKDGKTIVNSNGEFGSVKSVEFMLGSEEV